ncbi:MAG TPA: hypothetical protein VGU20_27040 [Stellaceae bacterium]|nr:hypothetical protein [Stellaceae bacterium]
MVKAPPTGENWAHELKYDGFRFHARLDPSKVKLLTRTGLDWTDKYESAADAISKVKARTAYLDGELCAMNPDGTTSFAELQAATDSKSTSHLVYFRSICCTSMRRTSPNCGCWIGRKGSSTLLVARKQKGSSRKEWIVLTSREIVDYG